MFMKANNFLIVFVFGAAVMAGCNTTGGNGNTAISNTNKPVDLEARRQKSTGLTDQSAPPSRQITEADIAKLKWLEGSWRGMDGDKPFHEKIYFEGTTMVVETFNDATMTSTQNISRFELKDGEFGNTVGDSRSAASEITDTAIQFVPAPIKQPDGSYAPIVKGNRFRFEKQADGTWNAILDTPANKDKPAGQKTYKMEQFKASAAK